MRIYIKGQIDKDLDSVTVVQWYKKVGDKIKKGENILHVETLKADVDLAAETDGVLLDIVAQEGEDILRPAEKPTGSWDAIFGWMETESVSISEELKEEVKKEVKKIDTLPIAPLPVAIEDKKEIGKDFIKAVPFARKRARELGVDLSTVSGTGPGGTVTLGDLEVAPEGLRKKLEKVVPTPKESVSGQFRIVNLGIIENAVAENMESSKCIPHAGVSVRVNFWNIIKARKNLTRVLHEKVGDTAAVYLKYEIIVIEGILRLLSDKFTYYVLNSCYGCSHFGFSGLKIFDHINLGIAYDHPAGLIVPVLSKMEGASFRVIAERLNDLYLRLEKSRVKPAEFKGGTFTFNNVGTIGADDGESIITHGQSCIFSFHRIDMDEDSPFYGYANLGLRFDHRAHTRGATPARFLNEVKKFIEEVDFEHHVLSEF